MEHQHASNQTSSAALESDEQEAWGIAFDLVAELGRIDAVVWADEYMDGLRDDGDDSGVVRWSMVTDALCALTSATVH